MDISKVSRLGFGCSHFGSFGNQMSNRDSQALLDVALNHGVNLVDTADIYGQGDSERIVGRALAKRRDEAFVVTKVGQLFSPRLTTLAPFKRMIRPLISRSSHLRARFYAQRTAALATNFAAPYLGSAIDRSLQRLQMPSVDCVLLHSPPAQSLTADAIDALVKARRAGKVGLIGVSCDDAVAVDSALCYRELTVFELPPAVFQDRLRSLQQAAASRPVHVLLREVMSHRGGASPSQALRQALASSLVRSVIVRTTSLPHLAQLARAAVIPHFEGGQQRCEESDGCEATSDGRGVAFSAGRETEDASIGVKR